jgi:hypothetical protein
VLLLLLLLLPWCCLLLATRHGAPAQWSPTCGARKRPARISGPA